jgi:hypothetical protein
MSRYMISIPLTLAERIAGDSYQDSLRAVGELRDLLTAKESLKFENQRVTPARFKCLACGDYHEGTGNLPCPKMSPMSGIKP